MYRTSTRIGHSLNLNILAEMMLHVQCLILVCYNVHITRLSFLISIIKVHWVWMISLVAYTPS